MELSIRPVREPDAEAIVALLEPIVRSGRHTIITAPVTVAEQRSFIRSLAERAVYLAAVDGRGGRIVGIQDVLPLTPPAQRHVGEISTFVAIDTQRRGVGSRLCEATFDVARRRSYRKLMAMIRADNPAALAFYEARGFRPIGTARGHARIGEAYVDEVLAERWLDDEQP